MRIKSVEAIPLEIPFSPFGKNGGATKGWAGNKWQKLSVLLVRVETQSGLVGWGEAFSYNCLRPLKAVVEDMIAPAVIDRDASDISAINQDLQKGMHLWGRYGITVFALSGLDIALWDIAGKAAGKPVFELLGGRKRSRIQGYASLFRYGDAEIVGERAQEALDQGYRVLKLHEITVAPLKTAREVAGPDIPITVDTNCPWSFEEAAQVIEEMKPYDPYWIEEPLFPPEDFESLAKLQKLTGVPLAAGENACTSMEFRKMFQAGAVTFAQPSVTKVGGITEFLKTIDQANEFGVKITPHSPYFGTGYLATLHLLASAIPDAWAERFYLNVEACLYGDLIEPDSDGCFRVPDGPGLGMEPDQNVIRDYRVKNL